MIESGMSLSHMKTNVTIVSHGRVSLVTRLGPDCQRCKWHGYRTVFGARIRMWVCAAVAVLRSLRGSVLVVANFRNNSVYVLRSSARRHTHAPQPALNLRSRRGTDRM